MSTMLAVVGGGGGGAGTEMIHTGRFFFLSFHNVHDESADFCAAFIRDL